MCAASRVRVRFACWLALLAGSSLTSATASADLHPAARKPSEDRVDPTPRVPDVLEHPPKLEPLDVVEQAGVGGHLSYASANVLEVGGSGSLSTAGSHLYMRMAPFVGWFVLDGLQLTYAHELFVTRQDKDYRLSTAIMAGALVHFRVNDRLLIACGPELGPLYNGDRWGVLARPKFLLDVLIGRSGVLHPGLFLAWASNNVIDAAGVEVGNQHLSFGFDIAYGAMF